MHIRFIYVFIFLSFLFEVKAQTKIIMDKEGGVYTIPCKVNGLSLKFIFDTGASNVTISLTEALFMLKNGFLSQDNIIGSSYAQLANGEITENTEILIREIIIADLTLNNIRASIVHELGAPLLLGQTAISKLGKIQLDGNELTIFTENNTKNQPNPSNEENTSIKPTEVTKDDKNWINDKTTNTLVFDEDLTVKIYGQGLGSRDIMSKPIFLFTSAKNCKIVLDICVNNEGIVTNYTLNESLSSNYPPSMQAFLLRKVKEFKFAPSQIENQCGFMVFNIKKN